MGTRLPSQGFEGGGERKVVGVEDRGEEPKRPPTPSEGREVRCGCQYYQTDSLLPERTALAALWKHRTMGDHEYEPVAAPRPAQPPIPPVFLSWQADEDPEEVKRRLETQGVERELLERQFLNTPLEDDIGAPPGDGENEEEAMKEIGTPPSPSPPSLSRTPTTESRTDCELTTSQVDSSGLEELPLRRGARGDAAKGPGPLATSIKRKIRNQAGRLRTKMRSIPRPTFRVPEGLTRPTILHRSKAPPPPSSASVADSGSSAADTLERPPRPEKKRIAAQLFDFRTYPRIFERKAKAKELSKRTSSSHDEDLSGSSRAGEAPPRRKGPLGMRWAHRFSDIRYADDEEAVSGGKENGSTSSLRGSAPEGSWSESGGQQDGASPERRPGVLEEIDADEFFLREKGLSRDDVRRGEEISSEIRDAFRPTAASDGDEPAEEEYTEEEVVEVELTPPQRPTRKATPEWRQRQVVIDEGFMTFPPQRPKRRKGMIVRSAEIAEPETGTEDEEVTREVEERWRKGAIVGGAIMAEHLVDDGGEWEEGWERKEEEEKMEDKSWFVEGRPRESTESEGDRSAEDGEREEIREEETRVEDTRVEEDEVKEAAEIEVEAGGTIEEAIPPLPPKRRRRGFGASVTSLEDSRCISSEEVRLEEFDRSSTNVSRQKFSASPQPHMDSMFSPQAFTEVSLTSPDPEYASPMRDLSPPVAPRRARSLTRRPKERETFFQTVPRTAVSVPSRPQRRSKAPDFFTVPRQKVKPPERPARSGYATPGPPRAPRRRRASTPLPPSVPASEDHAFESGEDEARVRDLTAGEVVSKMRSRPLPPPPRPPRRDRTRSADRSAWEEVVEGHLSLGSDRGPGSMISGRSLSDSGKPPEEVSIAIQTDPLPYDYCVEERAVEDGAATQQAERQASGWGGRTSPSSWPTPPPTPPPVATRRHSAQRRQQATARRAQTSSQEALPTERSPNLSELRSRVTEGILGNGPLTPPSSPRAERRLPPSPPTISSEEVISSEIPSSDTPPSIPPLPVTIPTRDTTTPAGEIEVPPPPAPTPTPAAPADSEAATETLTSETTTQSIPLKTEEPPRPMTPLQEEPPKSAPSTPKAVHLPTEEPPVPPKSQVTIPPIAPPRPPKPTPVRPPPRTQKTEPTPVETPQTPSIPPSSFAQLRSPEQPPIYPYYPYSIPPPSFFQQQSPPSGETTGQTMPQVPPLGAIAMLCVGEISARKLVVSEFQGPWGPQQSPDPPAEPRRSATRAEHVHRRRTPSLPTTRRRSMRRRYSEGGGGGKEMKEGKEEVEDPEDDVPGIGELSGRLARACGNVAVNSVRQLLLTAVERVEGDGRTETAIVIALVMAVALVLLTMGHGRQGSRWEFYLPPPN